MRPLYAVNGCAKASFDAPATHDACVVKLVHGKGRKRPVRRFPPLILPAMDFILKRLQSVEAHLPAVHFTHA